MLFPYAFFWIVWREQNQSAFKDKEQNDKWLKCLYLCNLSSLISIYIREDSMFLFDFVEWVGSR